MVNVLIVDTPADVHARAVGWALGLLGHRACLLHPRRFPGSQTLSIQLDGSSTRHDIADPQCHKFSLDAVDVVWNRRGFSPSMSEKLHVDDLDFAKKQSQIYLRNFFSTICPQAVWMNPLSAAEDDLNKAKQLMTAARVSLKIPGTLLSNNPSDIRAFSANYDKIVFKPFIGSSWKAQNDGRGVRVNYTSIVEAQDLECDDVLDACPGIYQEYIESSYELRVTVMGKSLFAVRIDRNMKTPTQSDWKIDRMGAGISAYTVDKELEEKIFAFMHASGLMFGCIDFLVDRHGQPWFLECNQSGQFLWKELRVPQLPMLDAICQFLINGTVEFHYERKPKSLSFADFVNYSRENGLPQN